MEASEFMDTVAALHVEARKRDLFFQTCTDARLRGRMLTLRGQQVLSWASCSYLGLEFHPALIAGVHDAVDRYGTQFSSSRGYVSSPQYAELEGQLDTLFGAHTLVTPTTTLGHQACLGVLVSERDAIVLDHQVHASVHVAATLARANGARMEVIRHGELDNAVAVVERLSRTCRTVWVACDGVYSMYGDLAPISLIQRLLDVAPNVRLYVDDAHGMSWAGLHGRGSFLSRTPLTRRIVVATSFAKAFGSGGACLVFADRSERDRVRMCGGPLLFSGPLQPPTLGALIASARVHLSDEITMLQQALAQRTALCNRLMRESGLPLLAANESPIFFLRLGLPRVAWSVARRLMQEGHYVNVSMYPSVPMKRAGIRLAVTTAHTDEDVSQVVAALARHIPLALAEEGVTRDQLDALFDGAVPAESLVSESYRALHGDSAQVPREPVKPASIEAEVWARGVEVDPQSLCVEHVHTIQRIDRETWDSRLGTTACCSWDAMVTLEACFTNQALAEHNWDFHYVVVRDGTGRILCVTFFTVALSKDDMLMRDEVSRAIEERRKSDPYFLTSLVVMMGCSLSEGNHLWLDRTGPWRAAMTRALQVAAAEYDRVQAGVLLLRDLPEGDKEMDAWMLRQGFVKLPMFDSHLLPVDWADDEGLILRVPGRKRSHLRHVLEKAGRFQRRVHGVAAAQPADEPPLDTAHLHDLYRNVAHRKYRLNVFEFPASLLDHLLRSPAWEIVTLTLPPENGGPADGKPVAFYAAHVSGGFYAPLFAGLDYDYVYTEGSYRVLLVETARRAKELGMHVIRMGMDADTEKRRLGTQTVRNCIYVQSRDHFNGALMREIVAEVALPAQSSPLATVDH